VAFSLLSANVELEPMEGTEVKRIRSERWISRVALFAIFIVSAITEAPCGAPKQALRGDPAVLGDPEENVGLTADLSSLLGLSNQL
jgi:hypothetical protein